MAEQYWIGEFFVDLSRNQITQNKEPQIIAPKALAVLTHLAENQGKVVSQEALLAKVWPNTVVSPNTLQRSIAQLRKALGDDGKVQVYIKTHAKQGYSLECDVRWPNSASGEELSVTPTAPSDLQEPLAKPTNKSAQKDSAAKPRSSFVATKAIVMLAAFLIIGLVISHYFTAKNETNFSVGQIRALTASDGKEFASIYSPDGKYIIFHRYSEQDCVNNIWAKNLATKQEHQLTEKLDIYGRHSFSKDGKQLVFIRTVDCDEPTTQKKCYQLMTLDFAKAIREPQPMQLLLECKNSQISMPHWLNNNNIALMQRHLKQWQLVSYSIENDESKVIHKVDNGNIYYYDYSVEQDLLAVISVHEDSQYYIETLTPDGELISSYPVVFPPEIDRYRFLIANFSPMEDQLIFSTGRQLFTLSFDGQIRNVSIPIDQPIGSPNFHPDGDRALVIKGNYDSDVIAMPLPDTMTLGSTSHAPGQFGPQQVIERSTVADNSGTLQPNGEFIAFESERTGEEQVWLSDGNTTKQLSQFPMDSYIAGIHWAADGNSLLVNVNDKLVQLGLNTTYTSYQLPHPIIELLQWDSLNHIALALANVKGITTLTEINLATNEVRVLTDKRVNWAKKTSSGQLIYSDHMDRFWRPGAVEDVRITALDHQGADNKRFLVKGEVVYGFNNTFELWSYDLNTETFKVIGKLPDNIDNITDINANQLVVTARISAKKEIVELLLNQ